MMRCIEKAVLRFAMFTNHCTFGNQVDWLNELFCIRQVQIETGRLEEAWLQLTAVTARAALLLIPICLSRMDPDYEQRLLHVQNGQHTPFGPVGYLEVIFIKFTIINWYEM